MIGKTGVTYELILHDEFDQFSEYDGDTGVWSTGDRRGNLATNGPRSVFLDGDEVTSEGVEIGIDPISLGEGYLDIGAGVIPEDTLPHVQQMLRDVGQYKFVDRAEYYTGRISTAETWGQTYGYFEIVAQVPEGKGHWSAFWLSPADNNWPPEIDIFEAYGRGVHQSTPKDYIFNTAVFFDDKDMDGERTLSMDIDNPYDADEEGNPADPDWRVKGGEDIGVFARYIDAEEYGWDIYEDYFTYAAEWTPDEIIFLFGPDRDSLVEVFRTPTPDDLNSPMVLIANDQLSTHWGWHPEEGYDHLTFADDNTLKIDSISVYAMTPDAVVRGTGEGGPIVGGDESSTIHGTSGDDVVLPGNGFDFIELKGGADVVHVHRALGDNNKVISDFGADDVVVLDGFYFDGEHGALSRLTQVDGDVWLTNGAYPLDPQTIIFRDTTVDAFDADNFTVRWSETPDVWASRQINGSRLRDDDGDGIVEAADHGSKMVGGRTKTLIGSDEGDRYFTYSPHVTVVEEANGGVDTVHAYTSFVLPEHVENIEAENGGSTLTGNAMGNILKAKLNTTLIGAGGDDLYDVSEGSGHTIGFAAGDGDDHVIGFSAETRLDLGETLIFQDQADFLSHLVADGDDTVLDFGADGSLTFRDTDAEVVAESFGYTIPLDDRLKLTNEADVVATGAGDDTVIAASGDDSVHAGADDDVVRAGNGNDQVYGYKGDDNVNGGNGHDVLLGGEGNDKLVGSNGDDTLVGGAGRDVLNGGAGADEFHIGAGDGLNILADLDALDVIVLDDVVIEDAVQSGSHVRVDLSHETDIVIRNMDVADLNDDVFAIL